jgi:hypothetical protein
MSSSVTSRQTRTQPLTSRPLDLVYSIWFGLHLMIMFCVDLVPLYPNSLQPAPLLALRSWYISTYKDPFFVPVPPAWFTAFAWMEALYHVPLSVWAVGALRRGKKDTSFFLLTLLSLSFPFFFFFFFL